MKEKEKGGREKSERKAKLNYMRQLSPNVNGPDLEVRTEFNFFHQPNSCVTSNKYFNSLSLKFLIYQMEIILILHSCENRK